MAVLSLIIGGSGSGKSASLRNQDAKKSLLIQPNKGKSLPFKSTEWRKKFNAKDTSGSLYISDNYTTVHKVMDAAVKAGKKTIIVDDSNYFMQNESLRRVAETGYTKFSEIAKSYIELINHCSSLPDDVTVYIMTHIQEDDRGIMKPKTVGKMIDNQVCLEGLFTIVFRCYEREGKHYFSTKTNGFDCVKTPMGMFDDSEVDNDLAVIDAAIREYEGI
ncbi:MAG: ATP-binding protein [Robiginitomaculum sp.]|nr:MAG: ATP-binding protein [Robiginitomaculum sp.]